MSKNKFNDVDFNQDDDQIDNDTKESRLQEQNDELLNKIEASNEQMKSISKKIDDFINVMNETKSEASTGVGYLKKALNPTLAYDLQQEFQKIVDDSGAMIIAAKDGCMREFNDNVDKKTKEFADAVNKNMTEVIKQFNEAAKAKSRMYMSSTAFYILILCIIVLAIFFAMIVLANIKLYHNEFLSEVIWCSIAMLVIPTGIILLLHYKFDKD